MTESNRDAVERMVSRVVAAARKVGLSDDEIRIIVDVELMGDEAAPAEEPTKAPSIAEVIVPPRPGAKPRPDAEIIPELGGSLPDWTGQEEGKVPLGLENLFQIRTPPRRIKAPPKTQWDRYATGEGPVPEGPPGEAK